MTLSIAEIQVRYPHPSAAFAIPAGSYCVGGALCLSAGYQLLRWPYAHQLAHVLRVVNPALTAKNACWYAGRMIAANDRKDFATAWKIAGWALAKTGATTHTPPRGDDAHADNL